MGRGPFGIPVASAPVLERASFLFETLRGRTMFEMIFTAKHKNGLPFQAFREAFAACGQWARSVGGDVLREDEASLMDQSLMRRYFSDEREAVEG
jgi:hypothetical protein